MKKNVTYIFTGRKKERERKRERKKERQRKEKGKEGKEGKREGERKEGKRRREEKEERERKGQKIEKIFSPFFSRKLWLIRPHDMLMWRHWICEKMGFGARKTQV